MADLDALEDWAGPLLRKLEPAGRAKLARAVAQQLRRSQQQRIQAQRSPDGTPFTPRREHKLREKQGRVKKKAKMFQKLRTSTYLKAQGDARGLSVGFAGRIARIARVHQYGGQLQKSSLDSTWQRFITRAIKEGVITEEQRFALHDLKRRGITDTPGDRKQKQDASGHRDEAMLDIYDFSLPRVSPSAD